MLRLVMIALVVATGCKVNNPASCEIDGNPNPACTDGGVDPVACDESSDCGNDVCLLDPGVCVECLASTDCVATSEAPVCDTAAHTCGACTTHSDCPSEACLPTGACAPESDVAYVKAGATGGAPCDQGAPCATLNEAIAASRPVIKVQGTAPIIDDQDTVIDGATVTIVADIGAKLDRSNDGTLLEVKGSSVNVTILDLEFLNGTDFSKPAILLGTGTTRLTLTRVKVTNNQGVGVSAGGGFLTLSGCTISGNDGGGVVISAAEFDLTNNFIFANGEDAGVLGGLRFDATNSGTRRFEFNTVSTNRGATATGVFCTAINTPVTFSNNIIYNNLGGGARTQVSPTLSNCLWTFSDIGPGAVVAGEANKADDPLFVDPASNFHLQPGSPAAAAANPAATLGFDIDGDVRSALKDIGADEIP